MDNPGRLFSQVAAEAEVSVNSAKIAVYLLGLSRAGRTLEYAARSLNIEQETVKRYAHLIDFSDYRPFARERDKGVDHTPKYRLDTGLSSHA